MRLLINNTERFERESLELFIKEVFLGAGLDDGQAAVIAKHLVLANLRGVDSHGISRVEVYTKRLDKGLVNKKFNPVHSYETPASALIDAQNTSGIPVATYGIELAIKKAKNSGIGIVGINNSNHCGMLADYVAKAAEEDCIAIAATNAPANMPPWGGKKRFFGTNPIAYGVPAGKEMDIIFDMATSKVARGKIILAQKNKQKIPLGWALSPAGTPTEDPKEALDGVVLPVGGHKGYGIAFLVETLSALFTGAAFGPYIGDLYKDMENAQNTGQFFLVMRADLFQPLEIFKKRMDQMIGEIRTLPLMEGAEKIFLPGEIEMKKSEDRTKNGIPISKEVISELLRVANHYKIRTNIFNSLV
ncbi:MULTISPECIES: Ldh family oxidoreductase [unclassified Cytobacillus]|uniref:Ldh family oxidoreductase n=1 Tax=unclassified Cytobacillus TaxID=2675268 RepID=UPI00203D74C5|nr:Ldh family oxidoreductase [Cytobacillus sp. AMY 15.2]MCM3093260.1 Ldh family oxidoreductase [Cytobacillus sp. AMY 15.2]